MYTEELIKRLSEKTGIDISKFDINELVMGMNVELEHGSENNRTDVTGDDPEATFKIVMAHMHEMPDYYTRLKKMEKKENISEYARRMRELAGLSEGNQKKTLKTIQEGENSFEEGATFFAKDMMGESKDKDLENPEKADLDGDGELSAYEKKRGKAVEKAMKKESINENFMSDEMYEKMRAEAIQYLINTSGWVTVVYDPNNNDLVIYKDAVGLDPERDEIESEDIENYMELSVEEVLDLVKSGKVTPYVMDEVPDLSQMNESKEKKEFETHKFEQKTIEEGENDEELYNLNEGTIIILDFLNENEEPLEGDMYYEIQVLSSPGEVDKIVRTAESMLDMFPNGIARRGGRFLGFKTEEEKYNFTDLLDNSEVDYKDFGIKPGTLNN